MALIPVQQQNTSNNSGQPNAGAQGSVAPTPQQQQGQTQGPMAQSTSSDGITQYSEQPNQQPQPVDIGENLGQKLNSMGGEAVQEGVLDLQTENAPELNISNLIEAKHSDLSLESILKVALKEEASDVHLTSGYRPIIRVDGKLKNLNAKILQNADTEAYSQEILSRRSIKTDELKQVDLSYTFEGRRFRVNVFRMMDSLSIVMRVIPQTIKSIEELELPQILKEFAKLPSGLVLVTGPTGSGKSTTLAALLNYINTTRSEHIITLEDPIEFIFPKGQSLIDQREMGQDFNEWTDALRSILRQDPNVVLVGEMRDFETITSTMTVSETGHLVFATLHTNSASQTIDRIIDVFPEAQQEQIRAQLAQVLSGVVSQRLVPLPTGGRKAVHEIMVATSAIKNAIREGQTHQIDNMIQTGQDVGMLTMEKSLADLVRKGLITADVARKASIKPDELDIILSHA
jgi:twitching motility protein PilT